MKPRLFCFALAFFCTGIFLASAQERGLRSQSGDQSCVPPACWTGNFYQYELVAYTEESVQVGNENGTLTGFGVSPSINEDGTVAFVGQVSVSGVDFGDTLFLGTAGSTALTAVAPNFLDFSRTFDDAVQINDGNQIVAQDRFSGSPPSTYLRVWDGNNPDLYTIVTEATGSSHDKFKEVLTDPAINSSNGVAFSALDKQFNGVLGASDPPYSQLNQASLNTPLRPLIADDGSVVVRAGNTDDSPIVLYSKGLKAPLTIADAGEFGALGQSPGISRDGTVVAFAGDLISSGKWDEDPGPGIFVAIISQGAVKYRMRVAGFHFGDNDGIKEMGGVCVGGSGSNCNGGNYFVMEGSPWCDADDPVCLPGGELEDLPPFNKSIRVYFNTFTEAGFQGSTEWENRIAVTHTDFGKKGIDGDTIVVSFIATPNMDDSTGLDRFSANQGIWTVRADLFAPKGEDFFAHVYRPIPVVQVGDSLGSTGFVVESLAVYDQLANVTPEQANGDHALGFWVSTNGSGQAILRSSYIQQYGASGWNAKDCCTGGKGGGTLGALVSGSSGTNLILSNDHVLGIPLSIDKNGAKLSDPVSAPGPFDYACEKPHTVGLFSTAPTLGTGVDAAVATLNVGEVNTTGQIYDIGIPASTPIKLIVGAQVAKQGRTSGLTCGTVKSIHLDVKNLAYPRCKAKPFKVSFRNQIAIESGDPDHPFTLAGDSGSLVVTQATAQPAGLLFGGSVDTKNKQELAYANPISAVASQLGITFVGGETHLVSGCRHGQRETLLSEEETKRARVVKDRYEARFFKDPAVLGMGVGAADNNPAEGVVVVMVQSGKQPQTVPSRLDGVRTKIIFTDPIKPLAERDCAGVGPSNLGKPRPRPVD